jgi:hypothetical protein
VLRPTLVAVEAEDAQVRGVVASAVLALAGVVFADEAAALERRMNGGAVESSTGLRAPERTSEHLAALSEAEADGSY